MATKRKSRLIPVALLLSALLIATASAAIFYQITASMTFTATVSVVIFTSGEDTATCNGTIGTNATSATFGSPGPGIPLAVEADIIITELVNVTNTDSSAHNVEFSVGSEDFSDELDTLKLYAVAPDTTETLVVELNGAGVIITQNVSVNILAGQQWAIKLVGHYDSGTSSSQSNSMTLNLKVTG